MKKIFERLKEGFLDRFELQGPEIGSTLKIIRQRKNIRRELSASKVLSRAIGIYCPALGEGMLVTAVDDILNVDKEEIVVLKPYDMNGILLHRTHLSISEIRSVCPFDALYRNPHISQEEEVAG